MCYFIAFHTKNKINFEDYNIENSLFLNEKYEIIDNYSAVKDEKLIYFDYLITDNIEVLKKLNVEFDNDLVLINYNFQTTLENVFAFSNITSSILNIDDQIKKIIEFIKEN